MLVGGGMSDIFISHIHEDEIAANALKRFITAKTEPHRLKIFVSSSQLRIGDEWLDKIRSALKAAKVVIALFSPEAISRPWVNFEAGGAWFSSEKILMPLCLGGLNPATLPKPYSNIQGADLTDDSTPWTLIQDIWEALAIPGMTPPPFSSRDEDLKELAHELERWKVASRAWKDIQRIEARDESK